MINNILIIILIIVLYLIIRRKYQIEHFNKSNIILTNTDDLIFSSNQELPTFNNYSDSSNINFDYEYINDDFNYESVDENINNNNKLDNIYYNNIESDNKRKFINNLNTWYGNRWIESIDENGNPIYNSSNNTIYDSEIIINKDIENINSEIMNSSDNIDKPIKFIYDSSIDKYQW